MSGFEIAGVVLGALPLLLEGAKISKSYFERCRGWWYFRNTFEEMINSIEDGLIAHRQNMELLLQPLNLDAMTESRLLGDGPLSPDWHDPGIQASLRTRIGHEHFPWMIGKLRRLDEIIESVSSVLPIRNGKVR
jgi:hypothetical protein